MGRAAFVATGTVLGAAAVMAIPTPGKPQQVALAGNAGTTAATGGGGGSSRPSSTATTAPSTATTAPKAPQAGTSPKTVLGSTLSNQFSQLQVKLTVASGRITDVGFTTFTANDGNSMQIDQYAVPILIKETIAAQSAHIQGVSGATYTTTLYEQSLQAAIDKAGLHA
jgi:uncharacterized protein with FMN-binding domain